MRRMVLVGGVLLFATFSEAQVHRTFIGVLGNDGNDCLSAATACRTINGAVGKVDPEGEVIVVSTGSYAGGNITKAVRINAPTGIVAFAALPITVNAPGAKVSIRGFTMKAVTPGSGIGIDVLAVGTLLLENMVVDGWSTGLQIGAASSKVSISDSTFRNNTSVAAIDVTAVSNVSIVKSRIEKNLRGVRVNAAATVSVSRSSILGNVNNGFFLAVAGSFLGIDRCLIANGPAHGLLVNAGTARLSNSAITDNAGTGVFNTGGVIESFATSAIRGNGTNVSGALTTVALQ